MSHAIEQELAIRDLAARYIDAVNRRDAADWGATWSERGVWEIFGQRVEGRAAIVPFWEAAMAGFPFAFMQLGSGTLELGGADAASGRWYMTEHLVTADGQALLTLGRYDDRYVREDGAWRFALRTYTMLRQTPA
jgi:ketosteroid isomerase-like protein